MAPTAAPKVATNFFNSKKRVIYVSASGKYFITGDKGIQYKPKAAFVRNSNGNPMALNGRNIPDNIRAAIRKGMPSKLKGRTLGPRPKSNAALMKEMFKEPKGYSRRPRSNKGVSRGPRPGPNIGLAAMKIVGQRKTRKNKGVSRGPRAKYEPNLGLAAMKIVGQRKTRKNKGTARGPRGPTGPRYFPRNNTVLRI